MTVPSPATDPVRFKDMTAEHLQARLAHLGVDLRLARRLQSIMVRSDSPEVPTAIPEVPRALLERIRQATTVPRLKLIEKSVSSTDGFAKYLFEGEGPEPFEAVRIPLLHRPGDEKYIVCVSSQVGCAMGCVFCATGRLGFRRNLLTWEIVDQVLRVQADSKYPVRGVVFMGMGEPMLNYDRVMRAADVMSEPCGLAISARAITISTVGIVPGIRRFTSERRPHRLIVSLTSVDPQRRRELLPVEDIHPLPELMAAIREYQQATGERMNLAFTLLSGINTRSEDARLIAELTAGMPVRLDLIEVNDASGQFSPPSAEEFDQFRLALSSEVQMPIVRRYSGGKDVHGACGMLAGLAVGPQPPGKDRPG